MKITEITKKRGRPLGSVTKTKQFTITLGGNLLSALSAHKAYLSDLYKFDLTDEQVIVSLVKAELETK
ncbi:hypothetical protein UFOVP133_12 [uncultured Caudovirales phage]|uniref:Uncharacterized protein n=1 Tax=uncultured Caudovirales phage TaxID=2100421 RepID=A0A6J5LC54_9CAUD|nr:hypothetical protein UFOVP133_12 [uncultured Caudovirales phage]